MSKIVFLGSPAYGHLNPTLPIVQELVLRGEQVVYYNNEEFRQPILQSGALFHAYPESEISSTKISRALQEGNLANVAPLILGATASLLPHLLDELPREQPDLVVFDSIALWGKMAATKLALRAASSISHFVFDTSHFMSADEHALRYLRQMLPKLPSLLVSRMRLSRRYQGAFPTSRPLMPVRGGLNLMYTARALQPDTPIIDETFRFVGPSINPQAQDTDFPFHTLQEGPVIYVSLGTVHHTRVEFYRQCFTTFGDYPAQFILSVGRATGIKALGEIPPNFIVRRSVPQLRVLQHTDVFITHGGMNSIHEGLYYGVPLLVVPQQIEQVLNARLIEKQGAGLVLDKQAASKRLLADDLRQALEEILSKSHYREAATKVQQLLHTTGGYRRAADEIQAYLAGESLAAEL